MGVCNDPACSSCRAIEAKRREENEPKPQAKRMRFKDLDLPPEQVAAFNVLRSKGYSKNRALAELVKPASASNL
jgi:hypothetical protein